MPWDAGVHLTPLPEVGKTEYLNLVKDAITHGAKGSDESVVGQPDSSFFYPAVLYPVNER